MPGFTSLMYDGSRHPLGEKHDETAAFAELALRRAFSLARARLASSAFGGEGSAATDPEEAAIFPADSGVDAMA